MFRQLKDLFSAAKKPAKQHPKTLQYEELEQRVLFSADFVPGLDNIAVDEQVLVQDVTNEFPVEREAAPETVEQTAAETRRELAIVNEDVADYEQLIAGLQGSNDNRIIEEVVLDADRDGIEQVSDILAERSDVAAVHFITHGSEGQINLGNSRLTSTTLAVNSDAVAGWGKALTETGDILFYGCNIAADSDGQVLLNTISDLTGADVAASDDKTGNQDLGGDWELEYVSGIIETDSALNEATQQEWEGLLATYSVADDFSSGDFTGSTGSASWDGPWSTSGGIVLTSGEMRINLVNSTAIRQVDLSSAVSASLSFDFHTGTGIESGNPDSILIEVSNNGGTDWTILEDIHYFDGANSGARIYDISSHATATTQIRFRVANGYGGPDDFFYVDNVEITYSDTNSAPVIISNGGGDTASINVEENTTSVTTVTANDANGSDTRTYSVNGGVDCNKFSIDSGTGILTFIAAPDFDNPADTNADNIYEVQVAVFDGNGGTDTQDISVNVSNVSDSISGTAFIDEGGTNIGAGKTINVLVNGISVSTSVTAADGSFTVDTGVISAGDAVVLFIDNDATYKGVTVTIADGSDLSGVDVFADHVMVRHEGGGALTIADMDAALGAYSDTDIGYSVTAGALTITGGELYVPADHIFTPGGDITTPSIESLGTFNGGIGAINISGDLKINGGNFTSTSGILRIQNPDNAGFTVNAGSFNHNSGILEIATPANYKTLTVDIGATLLNDVIVNGSAAANLDVTGIMDIDGALTITSIGTMWTGTMAVAGDIVTTDTDVRGDATLLLTGSNAQTINAGGQSGDLPRLTINKSGGGTVDAGAAGTLSVENLTVSGGTFIAPSGILRIENTDDDAFAVSGGTFSHNSGAVEIATPANYKTLTVDIGATLLNDVIVNGSAAANLDVTGIIDIDGALTITSIGTMRTGTMAVAGDIVTTDTDVRGDATLLLTGSNAQTINAGGQSGDLPRLTINKSGGGIVDAGAAGTLGVENLTVSGGTFIAPSGILRIENTDDDAFAVSGGTFSHNSGAVEIATPANYKTLTVDIGATLLNDVIVNGSAAANLDVTGIMDIDGALTITSIGTMRTGTMAVAGDIVTTDTDVRGDATLLLTGSNAQTINAGGQSGDLPRLTINKSGGGIVDAGAAGTLSVENLTVSGGTFIAPSGILRIENTDDDAFVVSGGTFSHNSGAVEIATPANYKTLTVDIGATLLNDFIVNGSAAANLDVTGTLDIDGALTITSINQINGGSINVAKNLITTDTGVSGTAGMTLDGTGAQTIDATGGGDLANGTFTINKTSGTVTLLSDLELNGPGQDLTITQGALDLAGFNLTVNDVLRMDANGTLQLEGGETVTTATTTLNAGSTALYDGAGAYTGLLMGDAYSNLIFNGTGSWTLDNALDVDGNLTITSGTLDVDAANDYPINVAGNWFNSGTFNSHGGTVVFDGGNQSLSGSTTFSNLTKIESSNDATDVTLTFDNTATQTITGILTLDGLDTDDRINLVSDSPTNQWRINLTATATKGTMAFLDVTDSDASGSDASQKFLNPTNSVNGGNNIGWFNSAPTAANNTVSTNEDTAYTFSEDDFNFSDVDGDTLASVKITSLEAVGSLQLSDVDVTLNQIISKADIDTGNLKFVPVADANGTGYDSFGFSVNDGTVDSAMSYIMNIDVTDVADSPVAVNDHSALDFDGIDDYISIADSASLTMTNTLTMEAWIKANPSANVNRMIINKEGEYEVALFSDGTINWAFDNTDPGWTWHNTGYVVTDGEWVHIAVAYDNGAVSTYVNGTLVDFYNGSGAIGDAHATLDELRIGGRSNNPGGKYFNGQIDEVRIWNTVRTQGQIQASMDQDLTGGESGLVGCWNFNEGSGTSMADLTANGNTGTMIDGGAGTAGPQWTGYTTDQNTQINITAANGIVGNDIDGDGDVLTVTQVNASGANVGSLFTLPSEANLTVDVLGAFIYDPNGAFDYLDVGETAVDTFIYLIDDGSGGTDMATVSITITGAEDTPVIGGTVAGTVAEDGTLTASGSLTISDLDTSDNPISFLDEAIILGDNGYGDFVLTGGTWTYTLNNAHTAVQALDVGESLTDTHIFTASDGSTQLVTMTINGAEDASVLGGVTAGAVTEDGALTASDDITITDVDTADNPVNWVDEAATAGDNGYGTFEITGGTWTYTLNNSHAAVQALDVGESLTDTHIFTASDGSTQLVTMTINGAENAPIAVDDAVSGDEDTVITGNVLSNDTDTEADPLTANLVSGPAHGSLTLSADGSFSYTPDADWNGTDSFTYTANDGALDSNVATMTITVNPVNDAPSVASSAVTAATENAAYSYTVTANDIDGDDLTITASTLPAWLTLVDNGDGTATLSGTPTNADVGEHSVELDISDGELIYLQDFTLTVSGETIDPPVDDPDPDLRGSTTPDPELFENPETDDEQDPDTEAPTQEDQAKDPVIEDEQAAPVVEDLTTQDSAHADDQLVHMQDPQINEEILYLTDDDDMDSQAEERDDDPSITYYDNDLYKDLSLSKYVNINYTAADGSNLKSEDDLNILYLDSDDQIPADVNGDYDLHRQQIDESFDIELKSQETKAKIVSITAASFAAGFVSYLLRAGSLVANLMSTLPLWRGFDPIVIFSGNKKKKKKDRNDIPDTNEAKSETLFDDEVE